MKDPGNRLEWWFVHGRYSGRRVPERYFMLTLFRYSGPPRSRKDADAHSYIAAVLDPGTGRNETATWVDRRLVRWVLERRGVEYSGNLDRLILDAFYEEVSRRRGLRHFAVKRSPESIEADPLRLSWGDYSLRSEDDSLELGFAEPGSGRICRFRLASALPPLDLAPGEKGSGGLGSMAYETRPRLGLKGFVGTESVTGQAWFDHQWGGEGWFVSSGARRRALGWDWFGLNLDDGSDWVVLVHRDAQTRKVLARYAMRRDSRGRVVQSRQVTLESQGEWRSPRTAVRYPLSWKIGLPRLGAAFEVSALADDQEIPVFGPQRSVWEGAAEVKGRVAGRSVGGRARVELQGYGYVFDFRSLLEGFAARIDSQLEEFLPRRLTERDIRRYVGPPSRKHEPAAFTRMLSEPVWDMISRPGKRWRPLFTLLLLDALGQDPAPYETLISALAELCHTGSLIVDDIEDDSLLRRGRPCLHLKFGADVAINAANTLYFLPSILLFEHPLLTRRQKFEIHEAMTRQYVRAHFGQALDLFWSKHLDRSRLRTWLDDSLADKILQMYELKTAAPLEGLAAAAAIVARCRPALGRACRRCATALGTAFQIMDDVHGLDGDRMLKTRGEDLVEGKMTYVLLKALGGLGRRDRSRLETIVASEDLRHTRAGLEEGIDLIRRSGAPEACRAEAMAMADEAWAHLLPVLEPSEPKILLRGLCRRLMES